MLDMREMNRGVIEEFRANGGVLGGPLAGAPILLLTTTGRRTGRAFTTPLGFVDDGGRLVVAAANGGADHDPDWFLNLCAEPAVQVEVPGASVSAVATEVAGAERLRLLAVLAQTLPGLVDHLAATEREVPVVVVSERPAERG